MIRSQFLVERQDIDPVAFFREKGLRVTHQRVEIFREIAESREHPSAETIFEGVRRRMPSLSMDTVYRTLATLEELGLVMRLTHPRGGARYDSMAITHHHFICLECGEIMDCFAASGEAPLLEELTDRVSAVRSVHVEIRGLCSHCHHTSNHNLPLMGES